MTSRRLAGAVIVTVAALALLWGGSVGREPAPARPADLYALMRRRPLGWTAWALRVLLRRYGARLGVRGEGDVASLPLFWGLFAPLYGHPGDAERVMVAMQWRASAAARLAAP